MLVSFLDQPLTAGQSMSCAWAGSTGAGVCAFAYSSCADKGEGDRSACLSPILGAVYLYSTPHLSLIKVFVRWYSLSDPYFFCLRVGWGCLHHWLTQPGLIMPTVPQGPEGQGTKQGHYLFWSWRIGRLLNLKKRWGLFRKEKVKIILPLALCSYLWESYRAPGTATEQAWRPPLWAIQVLKAQEPLWGVVPVTPHVVPFAKADLHFILISVTLLFWCSAKHYFLTYLLWVNKFPWA